MISTAIIGKGNVGTHLANAFAKTGKVKVTSINSRNIGSIPKVDLVIIAVTDNVIAEISSKLKTTFVVHTSGSVPIDGLKNKHRKGVFYPLQTFSKEKQVDFSEIPFCIEAENREDIQLLETLARLLSKNVYKIDSKQRKWLHISAVFVCNFTNHLYKIGADICDENNIPFAILAPLIKETAAKIETLSPEAAQTGPAVRNDRKTIENHLHLLNQQQKKVYTILTESIQDGEKL